MNFRPKTRGQGTCCWPVTDENGVEGVCNRQFTKFDPAQKVCDFHSDAFQRERAKRRWAEKQAARKATA